MKANWTSEQINQALNIIDDITLEIISGEEDFMCEVIGTGKAKYLRATTDGVELYVTYEDPWYGEETTNVSCEDVINWINSRSAGERG